MHDPHMDICDIDGNVFPQGVPIHGLVLASVSYAFENWCRLAHELYSIVVDGVGEGIEKEVQLCYALATNKNNKGEPLYEYNCNQQRKRCQPGGL